MRPVNKADGWGQSHQTKPRRRWIARPPVLLAALGVVTLIVSAIHYGVTEIAVALILGLVALVVIDAVLASRARPRSARTPSVPAGGDPLRAIRTLAEGAGGGAWLGAGGDLRWRFARPERAVLLLGPPRSGKTSGVIIPAVLAHAGPVIVTSTKPDVARASVRARARDGRVWMFDPTGASSPPAGRQQCAVTTEHSLPVLEAAHIRPWAAGGTHSIPNGVPLRRDLHRLFDLGFVTIRPDMRFSVSRTLRDDYSNGRAYYELDGRELRLPDRDDLRPDPAVLSWHEAEVFLGR
jgi:hypothetical protein